MAPPAWASAPFSITVEVVPPAGPDPRPLLAALQAISTLPFQAFSVATNPVAKPRMSAMAFSSLLQQRTGKPAVLHCTTRDDNSLGLQALLWGAWALGITSVLVASGDSVALADAGRTSAVHDVTVFELLKLARGTGFYTGAVLDPRAESSQLPHEVRRLRRKVEAGAQFVVTQPVYDEENAHRLHDATRHLGIPVFLGILPLVSARHAHFLHERVAGIQVPLALRQRLQEAANPLTEGLANARQLLSAARTLFSGACLMPPFDRYHLLTDILEP